MTSNEHQMNFDIEGVFEKAEGMEIEVSDAHLYNDSDKFLTLLETDKNEILLDVIENESPKIVEDLLKIGYDPNATDLNVD